MKFTVLLPALLMTFTVAFSQDFEEGQMDMNLGANNGFSLLLPDYDEKFVQDVWRDYIKDFKGKTKKVKRSKEYFTDNADIPYLSTSEVDLYSLVESDGGGSALHLWIDLGGAFLDTEAQPEAQDGIELLFNGFQKLLNVEEIKIELAAEEKELNELERKLDKLQKLNERYHKEIENWKEKIADNEEKIRGNEVDQKDMEGAIEDQKTKVKEVEVKLAKAEN